jgi:hypothetical protein
MADGTTKDIQDVQAGDKVLSTDPETGVTQARVVTNTMVNEDNDLRDLVVRDHDGREQTIKTTDHHRIWSATSNTWVLAVDLNVGDQLREPDGSVATVISSTQRPGVQAMLDLTVAQDHTFYVSDGAEAVLVHNVGCDEFAKRVQGQIGGDVHTFSPPYGRVFPEGSYVGQPAGEAWYHHTVVVKDGRVYDQFTGPGGELITEWKSRWGDLASEIDFGF